MKKRNQTTTHIPDFEHTPKLKKDKLLTTYHTLSQKTPQNFMKELSSKIRNNNEQMRAKRNENVPLNVVRKNLKFLGELD